MSGIELKSPVEIEIMAENGAMLREVMDELERYVEPGMTTLDVDKRAYELIKKTGSKPAFLGLYGFPGTVCASVNEEIVHGIPGKRKLVEGDILSLDCGLLRQDFYADTARTMRVGRVSPEVEKLLEVTQRSLELGIEQLSPGKRLGDVSAAIQGHIEKFGYGIVREYTGHGIGRKLHEDPKIPNHGRAGTGRRWEVGMVVCVEPMVNLGTHKTRVLEDDWTVVTADGKWSAHIEHTVAVTEDGPRILT